MKRRTSRGTLAMNVQWGDVEIQKAIAENTDVGLLNEMRDLFPGLGNKLDVWNPEVIELDDGCTIYSYAWLNMISFWDELKSTEPFKNLVAGKTEKQGQLAVWTELIYHFTKCVKEKMAVNRRTGTNPQPLRGVGGTDGIPKPPPETGMIPGTARRGSSTPSPDGGMDDPPPVDWPKRGRDPRGISTLELGVWVLCCKCDIMTNLCNKVLGTVGLKGCAKIKEVLKVKNQLGEYWLKQLAQCWPRDVDGNRHSCLKYFRAPREGASERPDEFIADVVSNDVRHAGQHLLHPRLTSEYAAAWPPECECDPTKPPPQNTIHTVLHIKNYPVYPSGGTSLGGGEGHAVGATIQCNPDGSWDVSAFDGGVQHDRDPTSTDPMAPSWTGVISRNGVITKLITNASGMRSLLGRVVTISTCLEKIK